MKSKEFKALDLSDFRTKKARDLRDERLRKKSVGFVHQASRYRGKANYREALFLAYGDGPATHLSDFNRDLTVVLRSYLAMAGAFSSRKLGKDLWAEFVGDVDAKRAFSTLASDVWSL